MPADYPTSIRLQPELKRAIKKVARMQGCSVAFKINQILVDWVKVNSPPLVPALPGQSQESHEPE